MFSVVCERIAGSCNLMTEEKSHLSRLEEEARQCLRVLKQMKGFEGCISRLSGYIDAMNEEENDISEMEYILDRINMTYHNTDNNVENRVEMGSIKYNVHSVAQMKPSDNRRIKSFFGISI